MQKNTINNNYIINKHTINENVLGLTRSLKREFGVVLSIKTMKYIRNSDRKEKCRDVILEIHAPGCQFQKMRQIM